MEIKKITRSGIDFFVDNNERDSFFWDIAGWERNNYEIILELSKQTKVFVHAGGWIGPFTLFAAKLFDKVICMEPDPVAYDQLRKNVELNGYKNVILVQSAFSDDMSPIRIGSLQGLGKSNSSIFQSSNSIEVQTTTINSIYEDYKIKEPSLLMLDVEGSEFKLFDDILFYKTYKPYVMLSLHLSWLTDENYDRLLNGFINLSEFYEVDVEYVQNMRKLLPYNSSYSEVNILLKPKNF